MPSHLRFLMWRTGMFGKKVTVKLTSGERLLFSGSWLEVDTASDIFVNEPYRSPRPIESASIRRIVDVGANVGYSVLYWAAHFPDARIDAFEPHPVHLDWLRQTISLNHLTDSVTVHAAAAGTTNGRAELIDCSVASAVVGRESDSEVVADGVIPIEVVDFFQVIGDTPIDLLKLDCEGAEFDLLMDKRFDRLDVRNLVMEWHESSVHPSAERDLSSRLLELGWDVQAGPGVVAGTREGLDLLRTGVMWAFPPRYQQ